MNYWLKFKGVFRSQSGPVCGDNLIPSWTQMSAIKWLASSHVNDLFQTQAFECLYSEMVRITVLQGLHIERNSSQDWCLGKGHLQSRLTQWRGTTGKLSLWNSCSSYYFTLAHILKWQTALLSEIFQNTDYWFHSTSPFGKGGLSLEGGGKGKAVTAARAGSLSW